MTVSFDLMDNVSFDLIDNVSFDLIDNVSFDLIDNVSFDLILTHGSAGVRGGLYAGRGHQHGGGRGGGQPNGVLGLAGRGRGRCVEGGGEGGDVGLDIQVRG